MAQLNREKEALLQAASVDYRTGLANAAAFDAAHEQLHSRMRRSGDPYSVLLVDIDHFHGFNHLYHYLEGNRVLSQVSAVLRSTVRDGDRVFRWGGEEFAVLLPATRLAAAAVVAERLRAAVQAMGVEHAGNPPGVVTVTVGVAEATGSDVCADDVFEAVSALQAAGKDAGRNRIVTPADPPDS
ncbi:MAG: GGDEF domain-containing protein [Acidobacteriota bacterium]|nr:GGDEF domain-containing protein [Acidobacteriota bacterium]